MPSSVQVLAAATIGVSATLSATKDSNGGTGFPSLSYTTIGEIVDLPEVGRQYNVVKHNPIASRGTTKLKGAYDDGSVSIAMARDDDDAGQVIILAALASDNAYAIHVTYADSSDDYFDAKVIGYKTIGGTQESVIMRVMQLELTTAIIETT